MREVRAEQVGTVRREGAPVHDLRSWYQTRCIEDGADSPIIRRTTHAPDKSVNGGYERFSWPTICREVGKLSVSIIDGKVLELSTDASRAERRAQNRWREAVTPRLHRVSWKRNIR